MKFCKDCAHYTVSASGLSQNCQAPQNKKINYIGDESFVPMFYYGAQLVRESQDPAACGVEAQWFEAKEVVHAA